MPPPRRESRLPTLLLFAAAVALVVWVGGPHHLRFVDVIGFSRRARELTEGKPASDGLYPLGYPALLAVGHAFGAPVYAVARALSAAAAVGLVLATKRRLGFAAGVWILLAAPVLQWGTTEGTDLLAAALAIAAVFTADRPVLAGLLLGAAVDVRWTAAAWLPALLVAAEGRGRAAAFGATLVGTLPHWMACAWCGDLVLPDQSLNLAIAAGPGAPPPAAGVGAALARIPEGLGRAWPFALPDVPTRAAAALLTLAALLPAARKDAEGAADRRTAAALLLGGALHLTALAAVFANARLALPTAVAALLGPAVLAARVGRLGPVPRLGAGVLLVAGAAALGVPRLEELRTPAPEEKRVAELAETLAASPVPLPDGPVLSNSPLAHTEAGGWLVPSVQLGGLYVTPRTTPAELGRLADEHQLGVVVLDPTRGRRDYAGLLPLFEAKEAEVDGWARASTSGWRVWVRGRTPAGGPR